VGAPDSAGAQSLSFGPLTTEEGGPLQRLAYTPTTEVAHLIGSGRFQAGLWMGYSNIFEQDSAASHELLLDLERLITAVTLRYGVAEQLELGGRLTFETTGGGILDGFISGWHRRFGLKNGNRDRYPSDAYAQRLRDGSGDLRLDVPRRAMALEDVRLFAKWGLLGGSGEKSALSLRAVTRIPTQQNLAGSERTDVSVMALGRLSGSRWHTHLMVGAATVRAASEMDGVLRSSAWFFSAAAERRLASWISALIQYDAATPRIQGIDDPEVDGWPMNLVFGVAGRLGDSWQWDMSFQEDLPSGSPAVDFTLGIALRRTW
jgi:hypothetical protein